jgi:uncharacterized protein YxjI
MGLLRHRDDVPGGRRFQMQQKLAQGDRLNKVDGKALRVRDTFVWRTVTATGGEHPEEEAPRARHDEGRTWRPDTRHRPQGARRDSPPLRYRHRGRDALSARGNIVDHEYEVKRDGEVIATVSTKWLRVRDTYGIEIRHGEDEPLLLARAVALDNMSRN